jgi:phosphatidylserine/phosphatidylglycerophosphate/cardiolipin synthase-like enzyme
VQAYHLTSSAIAAALKAAHEREVKVHAVLDKEAAGEKYSAATYLHNAGGPTWLDGEHAIAHNKVIIIDGATVINESFNEVGGTLLQMHFDRNVDELNSQFVESNEH